MPKFARLATSFVVAIGIGSAIALVSPGAALAGGCFTSRHTVTFGGYNKDILSARLCWNSVDASIGNVRQGCRVIEPFSRCDGHRHAVSGNYSTRSATVYGTYYGSGPDNSYEGVIRITIHPGGRSSWGWYYIYDI